MRKKRRRSSESDVGQRCAAKGPCAPARYCSVWLPFADLHRWDDANSPYPGRATGDEIPWENIPPSVQPASVARSEQSNLTERCEQAGVVLPRAGAARPPALRKIQWLHVPKSGTSFGTTLYHFGCPRIPHDAAADDGAPIVRLTERYPRYRQRWCNKDAFTGNLNGHEPVRYPCDRTRGSQVVALLRAPAARRASECAAVDVEFRRAFGSRAAAPPERIERAPPPVVLAGGGAARRHTSQGRSHAWQWRPGSVYASPFLREFLLSHGFAHADIRRLTEAWNRERRVSAEACAALRAHTGCQTKMVLGAPCAAPLELNASLLAEAVRRITHDFAFVGVTERFDASVCLFHARFGGAPRLAQFRNVRPTASTAATRHGAGRLRSTPAGTPSSGPQERSQPHDPWDAALHAAALARFEAEVRETHGVLPASH